MNLVGFIIRIFDDARSPERHKFEKLVPLVGFIIRIFHDARSPERQIRDMYGPLHPARRPVHPILICDHTANIHYIKIINYSINLYKTPCLRQPLRREKEFLLPASALLKADKSDSRLQQSSLTTRRRRILNVRDNSQGGCLEERLPE